MSLRAMLWALHDAPVTDPTSRLLLWALSDYAADNGTGAFPSVATLADTLHVDRRTVQRHLAELEAAGVIVKGDQQQVAHHRADRRPTVWDLAITGRQVATPPAPRGGTNPASGAASGAAPLPPDPRAIQEITHARDSSGSVAAAPRCARHTRPHPTCRGCNGNTPATEQAATALAAAARASLTKRGTHAPATD